MKNLVCGIAVLACLGTTASAITRVGENAELFLTGTLSARADDNIFLSESNEVDDTIFDITPGVELAFGQGSKTTGSLFLAETFTKYLDNDSLDDELLSAGLNTAYDDAKLKLDLSLSYRELNQSTRDVRGASNLVRRDVTALDAGSEISVSDKSSTSLGVLWDKTDFSTVGYADQKALTVPVNYYYAVSEKLDVSAGVRYRKTSVDVKSGDSKDYYYNVGVRLPVTAKLSGFFSVGYNQRKPEAGNDETGLGAEAKLKYQGTEKTALELSFANDYTTSAEGISQKTFSVSPTLITKFSPQWEGSLGVTYQKLEYFSGRNDDYIDTRVGVSYRINDQASVSGGYTYRSNDSDVRGANFDNSIISVTASVRF